MTGSGARRVRRARGAVVLPVLTALLVLAAGGVLWSRGDLNGLICDGDCGPAYITAPTGLTDDVTPGSALAAAPPTGRVDPERLSSAVLPALGAPLLGPHVGFIAVDPANGATLASAGTGAFVPASTTKLLTGFAALMRLDPSHRFVTRVVRDGGRIVLVGGGDPYLATRPAKGRDRVGRADLTNLARRTADALRATGTTSVSLGYDSTLFTGPAASPAWERHYVSDNIVTPVSALWADQGVENGLRAADPAQAAAQTFAGLLGSRGITVTGRPSAVDAATGSEAIASMRSATVAQIVEALIRSSDNQAAEVMLRHAAIAAGKPATFAGGTSTVKAVLAEAGITTGGLRLFDGSGLSRDNRITPLTLAQTIRAATQAGRTSAVVAGLAIGGFTGTLQDRFAASSGGGLVRAKTGTLRHIHSLAGYAQDADGHPVIFAVMVDRADDAAPLAAQAALDRVAGAIASCACGT